MLVALLVGCSGRSLVCPTELTHDAGQSQSAGGHVEEGKPLDAGVAPMKDAAPQTSVMPAPDAGSPAPDAGSPAPDAGELDAGNPAPAAHATSIVRITANVDSAARVPTLAFDPQDPANTSNFSTTMSVYDSLGNAHTLDTYFAKASDDAWEYHALVPGDEVAPPVAGYAEIGSGRIFFTWNGALDVHAVDVAARIRFANAEEQVIRFFFGKAIADGGTGLDGSTQFNAPANVSAQSQDGYGLGLGTAGDRCQANNDCQSRNCYQHTCFCGDGCTCRSASDCSNHANLCIDHHCDPG